MTPSKSKLEHWPGEAVRPVTIAELKERLPYFRSEESANRARNINVRSTDVFIATYPKCGTTWAQQIVNTLRTNGDMDFSEITEAVPWLETAWDINIDPDAEQRANPRAFKSHLTWDELPKGGRAIHITRDPERVAVSFYRFANGWMFERDAVDIDTFVREMILGGSRTGTYWAHLLNWWPRRQDENVLFMCYEDMQEHTADAIAAIARLSAIDLPPTLLETTLRNSSIDFMKEHRVKFDDHLVREFLDPPMGLPPGGSSNKVSRGARSDASALPEETRELLRQRWRETITASLGFADYPALRKAAGGIPGA